MYAAHTENPVQSTCILYIPQQSDNQITIHQITNPSEIPRWPPVHQEPAQALHARRNRRVLIFAVDISALNISAQRPGPHPSPPYQYTSTSIDEEAQRRFNGAPKESAVGRGAMLIGQLPMVGKVAGFGIGI